MGVVGGLSVLLLDDAAQNVLFGGAGDGPGGHFDGVGLAFEQLGCGLRVL
jgi:hypothetical protein